MRSLKKVKAVCALMSDDEDIGERQGCSEQCVIWISDDEDMKDRQGCSESCAILISEDEPMDEQQHEVLVASNTNSQP